VVMPVIEQKSYSKSLNRIINRTITLKCQIRGQAGTEVTWKRDGQPLQGSSFEKNKTEYPHDLVISAVTKTQINITYKNDRDIYDNFNCTGKRNNSRRLLCRSVYSCSASYPGATTSSQGDIPVTITPNIVLPDVSGMPSISNIKSRSTVITWEAADDYLESLLERYIVRVSNENYTMKIDVTSGTEENNLTYHLLNLTEYTSYKVSIAAESVIAISNFTEKMTFLTFCK
ncbi:receptor-type tyrosine- phosphatase F-like, partial [Paramuricea clavata]